ncbi:class I SAM-dependent methyltransferase [Desulfovibrio sp. OttesenSCG-928-O18]|nr:class I SAM-dependent methyltransferase [Desulfovibrio sp. OttesenSCG-928-O18]
MNEIQKRIGNVWSVRAQERGTDGGRTRWNLSETVLRHISERICGEPVADLLEARDTLLRGISPSLPYAKGISIGCGTGRKEMRLVERGLVAHFDLFELSETVIALGRQELARRGLSDKIVFHHADAFRAGLPAGGYDFVYWDNALHHMPDAEAAVRWSKEVLRPGGCFFLFDYVGPSRFQWTDEQVALVKNVLASMDDRYFVIPGTEYMWKKEPNRQTVEEIMRDDPSEAADSESILPAFAAHFPLGTVIPLGGLLYVLGLDGILVNIPEDSELLRRILKMDAMLSSAGHNYYAAAYAFVDR